MNDAVRDRIAKVLDEDVRPNLKADGGDVELVEITDEGEVRLRLTGACSGCPFSTMTLAFGVERVLKEKVPEIVKVVPVP
ncbi:MAG TPA: NifU family protein [candidate division WOR-3 bacterium]|uniref:NifU family protein n=1 Tax=candidate division WOR-3 bacterium TaxID=2052148 RepID=A0A7V0T7R1_UNCW3|nr:NifU family protein [candidate division WOR-3 bacterium]